MTTITVSIGRNVGTVPLHTGAWEQFRGTVDSTIRTWCDVIFVADAECVGHWDGVAEESRTWVAQWDGGGTPHSLIKTLGLIAREFGQDAIAVTTGTTVLAGLQPVTV